MSKNIHKINCDHVVRQMTKEKKEYLELFLINKFIISYQIINSQITKEKKRRLIFRLKTVFFAYFFNAFTYLFNYYGKSIMLLCN